LEYVTVEVWVKEGNIKIINFYNPCNQLKSSQLEEIWKDLEGRVIWCGDFNAHSTLWGDKDDINGNVLEEFIEEKELICLNDGTCTRIDISRGKESAIDLTFGTRNVADKCEWEVSRGNTVGSDHYPIKVYIGVEIEKEKEVKVEKWFEEKADWEKFKELSEEWLSCVDGSENIEVLTREIRSSIIAAANATIPKSKPKLLNKIVPWWSRECKEAIKERNKAFRLLKRTHNFQHLIEYKRAQAMVRQNVRKAKREYWKTFCDSLGRTTPIEKVWGMIRKMKGNGREYGYPVIIDGDDSITDSKGKAEIIGKTLAKVHSSKNLSYEERKGREETVSNYQRVFVNGNGESDNLNEKFTKGELNRALKKLGKSAPGKDTICYSMLENLSDSGKDILLKLYNKIWMEGIIPKEWKESIIVPIKKPGKDPHSPSSYRPIALTSQMGKTMEKMINDRLMYWVESKGWLERVQWTQWYAWRKPKERLK